MDDAAINRFVERFQAGPIPRPEVENFIVGLMARLQQGGQPANQLEGHWHLAAAVLADLGETPLALQALVQAAGFSSIAVASVKVLAFLYQARRFQALTGFYAAAPQGSAPWMFAAYYLACAAFWEDRYDDGFRLLDVFHGKADALGDLWLDDRLSVIYRQGALIRSPDDAERLLAAPPSIAWPRVELVRSAIQPGAGPVYLCSGNRKYLRVLLAEFLEKFAGPPADLVVVAINGAAEDIAFIEAAVAAHPHLRVDIAVVTSEISTFTYFACARFFALAELLPHYGRRVIALDIDCAVTESGRQKLEAVPASVDFACFRSHRDEPASYFQAGVMVFSASPASAAFAKALGRYCLEDMGKGSMRSWMLDQAALFSLLHLVRLGRIALSFALLNRLTGGKLTDVVQDVGQTDPNKSDLRGVSFKLVDGRLTTVEE